MDDSQIRKAAEVIKKSKYTIVFTGAGISVESGIPPFRGENGIWSKYDPKTLELGFFYNNPLESWTVIKQLFYDFFDSAKPNKAHKVLAEMEGKGMLECIITQNIDNLHQLAGNKIVHEFHGNSQKLVCTKCKSHSIPQDINFDQLPPYCTSCNGLLKPDFIFFGENIPSEAYQNSMDAAGQAEVIIVIGSTGEVMPAAQIPFYAKQIGATVIEVNPDVSKFTDTITDIYIKGKAAEAMEKLGNALLT